MDGQENVSENTPLTIKTQETTTTLLPANNPDEAKKTLNNFILCSILFAANPCCAIACLSLATARLGQVGSWQSGILYLTYTVSSITGATFVVKLWGARNGMMLGMTLFCVYVACFLVATTTTSHFAAASALLGAAIGGIGGGILWTAQGAYFTQASEEYSLYSAKTREESTALLAGIFAFWYLLEEAMLDLLSTLLVHCEIKWHVIFAVYSMVAVLSTLGMVLVKDYPRTEKRQGSAEGASVWYKVTAAWQLLVGDPKMKYLIGWCATFGFASSFVVSFVNGEVLRIAMNDVNSLYIGMMVAFSSTVAALTSVVFSAWAQRFGGSKGPPLLFGAFSWIGLVLPFVVWPDIQSWDWKLLLVIYFFHGTGRATFEGPLKALYADYFPYEKEGAFANIILQNGLSSSIGHILSFRFDCDDVSNPYCVEYKSGTRHNVLQFELLIIASAVVAILGYSRASRIFEEEGAVPDTEASVNANESSKTHQGIALGSAYMEQEVYDTLNHIMKQEDR